MGRKERRRNRKVPCQEPERKKEMKMFVELSVTGINTGLSLIPLYPRDGAGVEEQSSPSYRECTEL